MLSNMCCKRPHELARKRPPDPSLGSNARTGEGVKTCQSLDRVGNYAWGQLLVNGLSGQDPILR